MSMSTIAGLILCEFSIQAHTHVHFYIVVVYIISPREKETWARINGNERGIEVAVWAKGPSSCKISKTQ